MATLRKRRNVDGSTSWDATVRIVGYPTIGKSFRTKIQAELWAARTETAAKGGTLACGRGMIKSTPQKVIAQGTDWRFLNELKKELKV